MRTEVAKTKNAFTIRNNDKPCRIRPVPEQLGNAPAIVGADEHAARSLEDETEALAGESHRWRINQRLDFIDVVAHNPEEQRFVAVMQRVERDIFLQIVRQATQVDQHALDLIPHRKHMRRQETAQSQRVALGFRESYALVEQRIAQQRQAAGRFGRP